MTQASWTALTCKYDNDSKALRNVVVTCLQELLPEVSSDDFNPYDGIIWWDKKDCRENIDFTSLALIPTERIIGNYVILIQTTKILPEQIREITLLVSNFGYASVWVLGGVADTTDNRAATLLCEHTGLLVGEKDSLSHWLVSPLQLEFLLEAAIQTAARRKSYRKKNEHISKTFDSLTTFSCSPGSDLVEQLSKYTELADYYWARCRKLRSHVIAKSPIDRADWTDSDVLFHLIELGALDAKILAARNQLEKNQLEENLERSSD